MFHEIENPKIRNLVRGVLYNTDERTVAETLTNLRRISTPREAYQVAKLLARASSRILGESPGFPHEPQRPSNSLFLSPTSLPNELAFQRVTLEAHKAELIEFFCSLRELNEAVFSREVPAISARIAEIVFKFGFSIFLLNKLISIKYLFIDEDSIQAVIQSYLVAYSRPKRDLIAVVLEDFIDPVRSYAIVRKTVHGYIREGRLSDSATGILNAYLTPIPKDAQSASGTIQALGLHSVIDTQFYIWSRYPYLLHLLGAKGEDHLTSVLDNDVVTAIAASAESFNIALFDDEMAEFNEFNLLRHSNGWLEYGDVKSHRFSVERSLGHRFNGSYHPVTLPVGAGEISIKSATLDDLSDGKFEGDASLAEIDPCTGGYLHRVIGLMRTLDRGEAVFDYEGGKLLQLLNKTVDIALMATASELSSFMSARPKDSLYQYLKAALIYDCQETAIAGHRLRKATQAIIQERFNSIVEFMEFLYSSGRHVGGHFYATCTEPFLVQLYELFSAANEVVEARAQLLEAYARIERDEDAMDRAKALRLEIKLSKVRDDIDDNRIYIDPIRFHQWLMEKISGDLRAAIPLLADWAQNVTTGEDLNNPITLLQNPELRLGKILDTAYHEFCTNKFFGVDSYIGRRIRHGTLKGVMVTEVKALIEEALTQPRAVEVRGFLQSWLEKYERAIATIGDEVLQLHAESKSRGGIIATIATSNKLNTARAAVRDIAVTLEQDSPVAHAVATIQEYCWRLLETDLVRIRHEISRIRSESLIIDPAALPDVDGVNDLARRINEAVHRKFATLNLWLTQPKNVSPSAPLSLLFNAVLVEVKEQLPGFEPTIVFNEERALDLIGHRYHYVYDMLYILVYNAGKHGKMTGVLNFDVSVTDDGTSARISIESEINEKATIDRVKKRIQVAMEAEIENAFKVDSFSGIRKIRALEVHLGEVSDFGVVYSERSVRFSASLALTAI